MHKGSRMMLLAETIRDQLAIYAGSAQTIVRTMK
jgi:hypothetical protein